jgi:hypothetical protein
MNHRSLTACQWSLRRFARSTLAYAALTLTLLSHPAQAQQLPPLNLGDTSFLDGIAYPGWMVELVSQGKHDDKALSSTGQQLPGITDVNSGASLVHIAWIMPHPRLLGAWYGTEIVLAGAYVDTGGHGIGHGFGDLTFSPLVLQWPKHQLFGMPIYQRVDLDVNAPIGQHSPTKPVNIGSNAWAVNPYYVATLFPAKHLETTLRVYYLWNSTNQAPPVATGYSSTQAGQAIHLNATASYEIFKNVYAGANGYYLKQITDGHANGIALPNSRQQIGAIGPGAVINHGEWHFYINGYHEIGAKNMTEGNKLVLRIEKVFGSPGT